MYANYFPARNDMILIIKAKTNMMCKWYLYSNASNLMLLVSDIYRYVPLNLSNISGDVSLFKFEGVFTNDGITLRRNFVWDTLELNGHI